MKLNPAQQQAIKNISQPLLVLAGAGSGKTRVITQKIAYLLQDCNINPQNIYAITFTNKAASEMQSRITQLVGKQGKGLKISTFHALGLNFLRQEYAVANLKKVFSILNSDDTLHLLQEMIRERDANTEVDVLQQMISQWKNQLIIPEQALKEAQDDATYQLAQLYLGYESALTAYNAVDFDDLILKPVVILKNHPEILKKWQEKVHYLLVDEYQDTNSSQYEMVRLLTGLRNCFTVVGDDDQSIYAWRGAKTENIFRLQDDYPNLEVIKLEQNYRSYNRILQAANRLIANNPHVYEKKLWSELGAGYPVKVIVCQHDEHEAERVVSEILHHQFKYRTKFNDYAILYRGNFQSRPFEKALRNQQIPYYISGGTSFFDRAEIKDLLAYLRLLVNPDDDMAFLRIINLPRRGVGPQTIEKLSAYAKQRQSNFMAVLDEIGLQQVISSNVMQTLQKFSYLIKTKSELLERQNSIKIIEELLMDIDYEAWMYQQEKNAKAAEKKMQNVQEFIQWMQRLMAKEEGTTVIDVINKIILIDRLSQDESSSLDQVQMMTLHAAKGLEFPFVFLVGMEEELLPHRNSIETNQIEEERRLAYVGVTRAQKQLYITLAKTRRKQGENVSCEPSRFLEEMSNEDFEWIGEGIVRDEKKKAETARDHLQSLKQMLNPSS